MLVTISVVTLPTGQLVTVGAQLVMVYTLVTLVVTVSGPVWPGGLPVGFSAVLVVVGTAETGQIVV